MFDGGKNNGLAYVLFPEASAHICNVRAGQGMLWLLSMTKREGIIRTRLCVPGGKRGGGRRGREGRGRGPGESYMCFVVEKYLILFAVVKLLGLRTTVSLLMWVVVEIVTMLMVTVMPLAFICISVCVIKHCVPTTQTHRNMSNFNDASAPISIRCAHT